MECGVHRAARKLCATAGKRLPASRGRIPMKLLLLVLGVVLICFTLALRIEAWIGGRDDSDDA